MTPHLLRAPFLAVCALLAVSTVFGQQEANPSVTLEFKNARLDKVLEFYEALTGKRTAVDEDVDEESVTIRSERPMSRQEAMDLVRSSLRNGHGIELIGSEGGIRATRLQVKNTPAPPGYYDTADGLVAEALKKELQSITSRNHVAFGYAPTRDILAQIHQDPKNTNNLVTVYARKSVPKDRTEAWNREHVLPQSFGARGGDYARSDLHNLFPSIIEVNDLRGNLPFDESDEDSRIPKGAKLCSHDSDSWEPPDEVKGDLARVIFYMDTRYDGSDSPEDISVGEEAAPEDGRFAKLSSLLKWNEADPVSEEERRRNNQVFSVQGNRNPFIDRPEFVDSIYGNKSSSTGLSGTFQAKSEKENAVVTFKGNGRLGTNTTTPSSGFNIRGIRMPDSFTGLQHGLDIPRRPQESLYKLGPLR